MDNFIIQLGVNLIALGAFYGATMVEIKWIKNTLERHEKIFSEKWSKNHE